MGLCDPRSGTIFYPQRNPNIYEYQIPFIVSDYWFYTVNIVALFQVTTIIIQDLILLYHFIQYQSLNNTWFGYGNISYPVLMKNGIAPFSKRTANISDGHEDD